MSIQADDAAQGGSQCDVTATTPSPQVMRRREFIKKALKRSAGAYVGMSVIDSFDGPIIGVNGMPAHAVSLVQN